MKLMTAVTFASLLVAGQTLAGALAPVGSPCVPGVQAPPVSIDPVCADIAPSLQAEPVRVNLTDAVPLFVTGTLNVNLLEHVPPEEMTVFEGRKTQSYAGGATLTLSPNAFLGHVGIEAGATDFDSCDVRVVVQPATAGFIIDRQLTYQTPGQPLRTFPAERLVYASDTTAPSTQAFKVGVEQLGSIGNELADGVQFLITPGTSGTLVVEYRTHCARSSS